MNEEKSESFIYMGTLNAFNNLVNKPESSVKIKNAWETFCNTTGIEIPEEHYTFKKMPPIIQSIQSKPQIEDLKVTELNAIESIINSKLPTYFYSYWDAFYKELAPIIKSADSTKVEEIEEKLAGMDK